MVSRSRVYSIGAVAFAAALFISITYFRGGGETPALQLHRADQPLHFEPAPATIQEFSHVARGAGYEVGLHSRGARLLLGGGSTREAIGLTLKDGDPAAPVEALDELPSRGNYLIGDRESWRTGVKRFARVKYHEVYPGVDVVYHGNGRRLQYDFIIAAGANPEPIAVEIDAADRVSVDPASGDLVLGIGGEEVRQPPPFAFQVVGGVEAPVECRYVIDDSEVVRFELGDYDKELELIIDPVVVYSTYLGGARGDDILGVAVDPEGFVYVVGFTTSTDYHTVGGLSGLNLGPPALANAFLTKLSPDGRSLIYSTYFGGTGVDFGLAVAVDDGGQAVIAGYTTSRDLPTTPGAFQPSMSLGSDGRSSDHGFIARFDETGASLIYSTYLGGFGGHDRINAIALDVEGGAYVTGHTSSPDFPVSNRAFQRTFGGGDDFLGDAFVTRLGPTGAIVYSTYLGGGAGDTARAIAIDFAGNAYVTGSTRSDDFPVLGAVQFARAGECVDGFSNCVDAFVAKINPNGRRLVYSTYLGGSSRSGSPFQAGDAGLGIVVDRIGSAYVAGLTSSTDFPLNRPVLNRNGGHGDGFLTRVSPEGDLLLYSTFYGGPGDELASGIALDPWGNVYMVGTATSSGFPVTEEAFQREFAGSTESLSQARDGFIVKIGADIPVITHAVVEGKKLRVMGENFSRDALIQMDGVAQKTKRNKEDLANRLTGKNAGKRMPRGVPVTLRVINRDGAGSPDFVFTP